MKRLRQFLKESWSELKKVSWPNRHQVRNLTILVFVISFVVGVYITIADAFFENVIRILTELA